MGILVNESQIGGGGTSNSSHNIGDIFYTTRTDNSLNGAVECNGSQYNFSDFDSNLQSLFDEGKLPYISIGEFDSIVSEKGWCDKIGYGINELTLYPVVHTYDYDGQGVLCYTNILDWSESERDNNGRLLNVKVYNKDTHEEFVGFYVKYTEEDNVWWIYDDDNEILFDLVYPYRNGETITLPTGGEFQTSSYFKVPKLSAYIIQKENIPVIGNGITLGFTDGSSNYGFSGVNSSPARTLLTTGADYGSTVGSVHVSDDNPNKTVGITTDPTKSGMITDLSNDSFTGRVMIQLFNSTTDTAVATCNQVLSDISTLNQGDYVVYWDSYELSDHSHAYTGITLDEYQWYRIYKSGWVEQGGFNRTNGSNATRITIPVEMKSVNYTPAIQGRTEENRYINAQWQVMPVNNTTSSTTTTSFVAQGSITGYNLGFRWQVSGFSFLA